MMHAMLSSYNTGRFFLQMEADTQGWMEHVPDELMERYCMQRLLESELERVEAHLLVCSQCQQVLTGIDEYVAVIKEAARQLVGEEAAKLQIVARRKVGQGPARSEQPDPQRSRREDLNLSPMLENRILGWPEPWPELLWIYRKARIEALDVALGEPAKRAVENQYIHRVKMIADNPRFNHE